MNAIKSIVCTAALLLPLSAWADPALIITPVQQKGGDIKVLVEFVADPAQPVNALGFELATNNKGQALEKGKPQMPAADISKCGRGLPMTHSAICNAQTPSGGVKVVVFSSNPDAALASGQIGEISIPAGRALLKGGALDVSFSQFSGSDGRVIAGEVLSDRVGTPTEKGSRSIK